jgi:enoyl-CoA hydratase/carnithine racemase
MTARPAADIGLIYGQQLEGTAAPRRAADFKPRHFGWQVEGKVATLTLNRPERKNPITFQSYAEMRDTFRALTYVEDAKAVVITGAGGNFCSGGDVHEIIGPLLKMDMTSLLNFTRMTGDLIKAIRACPQVVIAAIDGVCAGAGSCVAMAADMRLGTPRSSVAFLFNRVGLAGCDMGACAMLPRIIGQGRASELLFTGRAMKADEAERWGFYNRLVEPEQLMAEARTLAARVSAGPTFANGITKTMLDKEWNMGIDQFIESEAQAQAICMQTEDFRRAFDAFVGKQKPVFEGN